MLGRIAPRWRTLREWAAVYEQIIAARPLVMRTLSGRRNYVKYIVDALGDRSMRDIRPHHIALLVRDIYSRYPQTARRVLMEMRDMFDESINYGWLHRNPAVEIKPLRSPVKRQRLSFELWQKIHERALHHRPAWPGHMLVLALVTGQRRADLQKMRFEDVWDGYLHIEQQKTGERIALPLALRLDAIGVTLGQAIDACRDYATQGPTLLRKSRGMPLGLETLSVRFCELRNEVLSLPDDPKQAPSLHECRSLSERLYRVQGIDTRTLLGHKRQSMTDMYNDDRGLGRGQWRVLQLPDQPCPQPNQPTTTLSTP